MNEPLCGTAAFSNDGGRLELIRLRGSSGNLNLHVGPEMNKLVCIVALLVATVGLALLLHYLVSNFRKATSQ